MSDLVAMIGPGIAEVLVIATLMAVMAAAPILVVIWFARKTLENKRENVKLRLEVGKLADELEQVRKQQGK
jgi:biopolymer transport protein ExbB/TolQ